MSQQSPAQSVAQAAVIPYRIDRSTGRADVLLIRRHDGGKWGIPKGGVDRGLTPRQAAAKEAIEEAGVEGAVSERAVGSFTYAKAKGTCRVQVYGMKVVTVHDHWDEKHLRERRWFSADRAAEVAGREAVGQLIRQFLDGLRRR